MIRVVLAGVALVLVALTFDASVLLVPGIALAALGALIPPWISLASRAASASRRLHGDRVVEEEPLEATIEIRRGLFGLPGGELDDEFAGGAMTFAGRRVPRRADGRSTIRVVARFPRRGRRRFEPPTLSLSDPFGLVRARRSGEGPAEELLVLPRTERVGWSAAEPGERPDSPERAAAAEAFAATEVDGLRPYRPGAPASRIHWAAVARGAGLLERRLRADASSGPLVVLDARSSGPPELLDAAVRATASLALDLARRTGCELLLPGDRRPIRLGPELAAWPGAHARLALVEGGPDAPIPAIGPRAQGGRVYYVVAERIGALERMPLDTRLRCVLVAPVELLRGSGEPAMFEVAGCRAVAVERRSRARAA